MPATQHGSLITNLPAHVDKEVFEDLLRHEYVRIERIVSLGQTTPAEHWYDQAWDEWVAVIAGAAEVLIEGEPRPRRLTPGDYLYLPAHCRHRVEWTDPHGPTVWLAIHISTIDHAHEIRS